MRRWEELTPSGQAPRLRPAAGEALAAFRIPRAVISLAQHSENTVFRVDTGEVEAPPGPYLPGRYALRVHCRDYQTRESIESEMQWLAALCANGHPVPAPVASRAGTWSTTAAEVITCTTTPSAWGQRSGAVPLGPAARGVLVGHVEHRPVPVATLACLDYFSAARAIWVGLWEFGMVGVNPAFAGYFPQSLEYVSGLLDIMGM